MEQIVSFVLFYGYNSMYLFLSKKNKYAESMCRRILLTTQLSNSSPTFQKGSQQRGTDYTRVTVKVIDIKTN